MMLSFGQVLLSHGPGDCPKSSLPVCSVHSLIVLVSMGASVCVLRHFRILRPNFVFSARLSSLRVPALNYI